MKMVHSELSGEIISESAAFTEWIIESPKYFSEYLHELYCQYEKDEGRFVLSQGDKILELSKYLEIIVNPFTVEINSRKILNKLYIKLEKVSKEEQMYEQTNYILSFDDNLEIPALLKAVGIKHEEMEDDFFERIIRYVKIAVEVLSTKVFVFVNIRSYLTDEQIQELIKEIRYQEAKILFMESQERACLEGGMRYIIDRDGCEIY